MSKSDGHSPSSTPTLRGALATGLANPALLAWQLGCWLCGLLDEVLVVFASLHLRQNLGADLAAQALVILSFSIGSVLGLVISDRLLGRYSGLRLARLSAAGCLVSYLAWLGAGSMFASGAWLFVVGIFCAPLYPVAKAQAYRALPGQPGVVNAVGNLFAPASLALPLVIGLVAEWHGLVWALTCLALQPLGLWFIAGHFARSGPGDEKDIRPKRVS